MQKIKRIIPDCMVFAIGMICGKCIFNGIEIWKTALIGIGIFVVLWLIWDGITEKQNKRVKEKEKRKVA